MESKIELAAVCGIYCGDCEYLGDKCPGCGQVQGKPFWTQQYGVEVCPLYGCCSNEKRLEHCGVCPDFLCETFSAMRDPSMSDEEARQALEQRQKDLLLRKELGTAVWLKQRG